MNVRGACVSMIATLRTSPSWAIGTNSTDAASYASTSSRRISPDPRASGTCRVAPVATTSATPDGLPSSLMA